MARRFTVALILKDKEFRQTKYGNLSVYEAYI